MTNDRELIGEDRVDWSDKDSIIDFYTKNQLYFNNYQLLTDIDSIIYVVDAKINYCRALETRHKYSLIIPVLEHIENMLPKIRESSEFDRIYENYLFNRGVAFERLKNFKESQKSFTQLLNLYPEDELYNRWYKSNKNAIWAKKFKFIGYIGAFVVFFVFGMDVLFHVKINMIFTFIGLFLALTGFFIEDVKNYIDKLIKK